MKRIIMLLCLLLPLFMWGCSAPKAEQEGIIKEGAVQPATENGGATVYGKVESIVGNEVVLTLGEPLKSTASSLEAPEGENAQTGGAQEGQKVQIGEAPQRDASGGAVTFGTGERPDGASGERPSFNSGQRPSSQMPSGENVQSIQASGNSGGMGRSVSLDYTGETATYLLPVGMAIGSGDFSNVSEGMVLALSLNGEGAITAVRILAG